MSSIFRKWARAEGVWKRRSREVIRPEHGDRMPTRAGTRPPREVKFRLGRLLRRKATTKATLASGEMVVPRPVAKRLGFVGRMRTAAARALRAVRGR